MDTNEKPWRCLAQRGADRCSAFVPQRASVGTLIKHASLHALVIILVFVTISSRTRAGDPKPTQILTTPGSVKWIAVTPDGQSLLTASEVSAKGNADGHELRLWSATTGKLLAGPVKSEHISASGAISPDGRTAVTGSTNSSWQLWNIPDLKAVRNGKLGSSRLHRIAFSPDGQTFAALDANYRKMLLDPFKSNRVTYSVHTVNVRSGVRVGEAQSWPRELWPDEPASAVRISEPAGWSLGMSPAFDRNGRPVMPTPAETIALLVPNDSENCGGPAASAISPDRKRAVSSGCNGQVVLWDYRTRQPIGEPLMKSDYLEILGNTLLFAPRSDRIAVVRMVRIDSFERFQPTITVYDIESRKPVGRPVSVGRTGLIDAFAFAPDGDWFAVAFRTYDRDGSPGRDTIQIWRLTSP